MDIQRFKETLRNIFPARLLEDDIDLKKSATMSEEEVIQIAEERYEVSGHLTTENTSRSVILVKEGGHLLWRVRFAPICDDGFPVKGGHLIIVISDTTKRVIQTFNSPY